MIVHARPQPRGIAWSKWGIIALCTAIFVWQLGMADPHTDLAPYWLVPERLMGVLLQGRWLAPELHVPLVSATFLHADALHLVLNMLFLAAFGDHVEARLGHVRFAGFFVLGGALASLTHVVAHAHSPLPVVGASGAVAAVMGCFLVLRPRARVGLALVPLRVPSTLVLGAWFALQVARAYAITSQAPEIRAAAWWAHSGGFAYGLATASWLRLRPARRRRRRPRRR